MAYHERGHPTGSRRNEDNFTVHVTNLPVELNEDGIAQIFQGYGEICGLLSPARARWAYVSYRTYREAEHAIRALNERSPLFLKVAFQKKKTQQNETYTADEHRHAPDFRYAETGVGPNASCRSFMPGMLSAQFAHCASYNQESDANSVYPSDLDHNIYNPFESVGRYAETNAMWSRGCVNMDNYGKRFVSMGRGFTRYQIPDPHPNLEQQIGRVYENRRAGLYEYGEDRLQSKVGKCQLCRRVTTLHCEKCAGFYCSRDCQISDWARHILECKTIPDLVGGLELAAQSRSSSDEQLQVPRKPGGMDLRALGVLRRPKTVDAKAVNRETLEQVSINEKSAPQKDFSPPQNTAPNFEYNEGMKAKSNDPTYSNRNDGQNKNNRFDENSNDRYKPNARQQSGFKNEQNGFGYDERRVNNENHLPFNKTGNFNSVRKVDGSNATAKEGQLNGSRSERIVERAKTSLIKMEEELAFQTDPRAKANAEKQKPLKSPSLNRPEAVCKAPIENRISGTDFTDVIVVYPMTDGTFWVHRKKDAMAIEEMMRELQIKTKSYPKATELVVGEMYAALYNEVWHRTTLLSTKPPSIFYVDFGNEDSPESDDFRPLTDFPKYPPYAIRLRLAADSKVNNIVEQRELAVKMTSIDKEGVVNVVDDGKANSEIEGKASTAPLEVYKPAPAVLEVPIAKVDAPKVEAPTPSASKAAVIPAQSTSKIAEVSTPSVSKNEQISTPSASKVEQISTSSVLKVATTATALPEQKIVKKVAFSLPSSVDSLTMNSTGYIQVYVALDNSSYAVCVLSAEFAIEYGMVYESLYAACNEATQAEDFKPQIGDFVCGKRDDLWLRGYVVSLGPPIRLALVDEARVSPVEKILPMPEEYKNICSFGSICTFQAAGSSFEVNEAAEFTVTGVETVAGERIVKAVLTKPDRLTDIGVTLKNWSPTPEQKGIGFADLKSNSEVYITAYSSERVMFVRSLDEASQERSHRITQNVAKWAQKAPMLNGPPTIGQLVIAKFTDGNFYRAIVTKLQDGKIGVSYVDYGNRGFTTIEELRVLSDELKEEKSCAAKVVLKDIKTDVPPTQEVHEYLNVLVGREQPLFCTFEGIPSKDGVILTTATGECVNLKVNEHLTPAWQKKDPAKDTNCFTLVDIEISKLGEVGQTNKALVLYGGDVPFEYFMCPFDAEHIGHVSDIMPKMIHEYCTATTKHYIPRKAELCLAPYEGTWYRGLCLNPTQTPTQALIQFIDFGNTESVEHTNIRQMTKDFISPAALACICYVKNPGVELVNGQLPEKVKTILDTMIPLNDIIDVKILEKVEEGVYTVEVPELRPKLVELGLLN